MTTLEITLIIIGVVFLIGSFMVNDKLSHKDLDKIADMSAEELKIITEKEVTAAKKDLSDALDEEITQKQDETKRSLEKEANSKIMAINEYSDTVLDSINKAHNEIMFLYSMLNDKHDELTRLSGDIDKASSRLRSSFEPLSADSAKRAEKPSVAVQKPAEPKSGTMQQDTKLDMKQMTGMIFQVSLKHSLLQQPLRQRQVQQLQQVQRPLYRSRHQMLLLVRQQAVAQMLM